MSFHVRDDLNMIIMQVRSNSHLYHKSYGLNFRLKSWPAETSTTINQAGDGKTKATSKAWRTPHRISHQCRFVELEQDQYPADINGVHGTKADHPMIQRVIGKLE